MGYRKIQGSGLFDGERIHSEAAVLVCSDEGVIQGILAPDEVGEGIEKQEGLLCPGFINTHCHLELSHMAGVIPPHTGMVDFLLQVMGLRGESLADPAGSARAADRQMYEAGIVAVGDISNNISSLPIKAASALYYHTFVEVAGFVPASAEARLQQALQVYNGMRQVLGEEAVTLVPHAPYSVSKPLFDALNRAARGRCLTIHNQESEAENQFYGTKEGDFLRLYATLGLNIDFFSPCHASSLAVYLPWLSLPRSVILVHNVATSADDIARVRAQSKTLNQEFFWCLCPGANDYIQQTMPPVDLLRREGCVLTLGTDSLASNYGLSILSEMKAIRDDFPEVPLEELLRWATSNGARALHIGDRLGSFGVGKQPGILVLKRLEAGRISGQTTVTRLL